MMAQEPEVTFTFSYNALIKISIALIGAEGYKVRSVPGHHFKLIEMAGALLKDERFVKIGQEMRNLRNLELYEAEDFISEKNAEEYYIFIGEIFKKAQGYLNKTSRDGSCLPEAPSL